MKKRTKKILISIGIIIAILLLGTFLTWYLIFDYSVDFGDNLEIPAPSEQLTSLEQGDSDWPSWKGANSDNRSLFTKIKTDWSKGLKKIWEVKYLCKGKKSVAWSCPAIRGNRLVIPGRHEDKDIIFCLDPDTGALLWSQEYQSPAGSSSFGEGPRATPTINGNMVYTLSRGGLLICWDLYDGKKLWEHDIVKSGGEIPIWGFAGSPVVYKDKLLVQVGNNALLYAFNKKTGEIIWKSEPAPASYSTPVIINVNYKDIIIMLGGQALYAFDTESGKKLWESPWIVENNINICTPVFSKKHNILVISSWYDKGIQALKITNKPKVLWTNNLIEAHQTDPFIIDKYIYAYSGMSAINQNDFKCLDLLTGEEKWSSKEIGSGQFIYVEPYFLSLDINGNLYLVLPDPAGLKVITKIENIFDVNNAKAWTKPVIANGKLYLRYANQLYCFDIAE